jgi:hypothetical protein
MYLFYVIPNKMTYLMVGGLSAILILILLYYIWKLYYDNCNVLKRYTLPYGIVEIVEPTYQDGLPHTRSATIIRMTDVDWNSDRRDDILRHERVHLRQRMDTKDWLTFYRSAWDYECTHQPPPGIPQHWLDRVRPNPDTADDGLWAVWRNRYVFFPTYRDAKRSLRNASVQVWDTKTHQITDPPAEWKQFFCDGGHCPHQYEHPHEIAAVYVNETSNNSPASQLLYSSLLVTQ